MTTFTNRTALTTAIELTNAVKGNPDYSAEMLEALSAKLAKMVEALDNRTKSSGSSKPTAKQVENSGIKTAILAQLAEGEKTIPQLMEGLNTNTAEPLTSQRVSALLTQLKQEGKVKRLEGKTAVFALVEGENVAE